MGGNMCVAKRAVVDVSISNVVCTDSGKQKSDSESKQTTIKLVGQANESVVSETSNTLQSLAVEPYESKQNQSLFCPSPTVLHQEIKLFFPKLLPNQVTVLEYIIQQRKNQQLVFERLETKKNQTFIQILFGILVQRTQFIDLNEAKLIASQIGVTIKYKCDLDYDDFLDSFIGYL